MNVSDWSVILIYLVLVFAAGLAFTRRAHTDTTSYFLSARKLPWWIAGTSMVATSFSCDTPLYVTQLVRSGGIWLNWQWWSFAIGSLFGAFFLARLWRRANVVTDVELTELRYGKGPGSVLRSIRAAWTALIINTISMSWVVLAMAKIIGAVWGGPKWFGVIIAAFLAVSYSFFAGFWGVVVTDFAQFFIALIGAIILAIVAVHQAGGMGPILDTLKPGQADLIPAIPVESFFSGDFWTTAFGGFLVYISLQWWANLNSDGGGKVIQRMSASKNEAHAFGATLWFNIAHFSLRSWPWIIAALASLVLLPNLADHEMAYPQLIMTVLPSPWKGILIAGLVAAFMSTIDTQLNWGASYLTHDIYRRFVKPGQSEKHYLVAAKLAMLVLIALTCLMAYKVKSVTEAFKFIIAFGAGTGPVYLLRWFWWRINAWTEIAAMIASTVISSGIYLFFPEVPFTLKVALIAGLSAVVFIPVTFLTKPADVTVLAEFFKRTRPPGAWKPVRESSDVGTDQRWLMTNDLLGWISGIALTIGSTLSIGWLLLGRTGLAGAGIAVTIVGAIGVVWWFRKSFK